jgi:hypothetical protein
VIHGLWKGLQKVMLLLVKVSFLVLAIELLKGDKSSGQMTKAYGVHPNTNGKSQRARIDA